MLMLLVVSEQVMQMLGVAALQVKHLYAQEVHIPPDIIIDALVQVVQLVALVHAAQLVPQG